MTTISHNKIHSEETFETAIIDHLVHHGWEEGKASNYDAELALFPSVIISFLQTTQPKEWKRLAEFYKQDAEKQIIRRLVKEIDLRGMLDVVRHGITDSGIKFKLAYFEPDSKLNQETLELYKLNRLSVTRQVYYSTKNKNSIDLLLSLNGLPIATAELKNHFTGQTVANAKRQFRDDRDPHEPLFQFKKRALVHFSVDPDEVYLTTKIDGKKTHFLPFNKGYNNGAGNPPTDGYRSTYLWEEIWMKDSWMNIISRFIHLQSEDITISNKQYTKETMIFPRYHQLRAVRRLCTDCLLYGTGNNYLIQHSAGSGKSNTIAWLSHRLAGLHDHTDRRIFDSIIVITDRTVLDKQLQDTIYQFEHKTGVVECIENNSQELADALTKGSDIIITTLQKFPYVLDKVQYLAKNHSYAIVIDEAHSSQGGNASNKMSKVLAAKSLEEAESEEKDDDKTTDDYLREELSARGMHPNTSIFAFTATPKPKTLEVFGEKDSEGKPIPFDLYSMRQAIEEGFILDVLANYTTYNVFYKLNKKIEDDPELNKKKAAKAIGRFLSLHPYNLAQKTEVIIEHFKSVTMKKIGGRAKAMVVTGSRLHALRYYHEFRKYIKAHNYQDIRALVAFSGKVVDDGYPDGVSEAQLNGFGEKELPERFAGEEYKILLVADKYQTGFDQPLLHTMYVDKKLAGVKAVQTLSRLNRTCQGKEDTFVLDFVNNRDEILASFQPFYELTRLEDTTDPNHLYDLKNLLDASGVYQWSEINAFSNLYFTKEKHNVKDQARLYGWIDPAVDRFKTLSDEKKDEFKQSMNAFVRLYSYLSQVLPFQDVELEKLYTYGRFLLLKLPKRDGSENVSLDNDVALEYYRLQKMEEGAIVLQKQGSANIRGVSEAGVPYGNKEENAKLSDIINILNDRLGTDFTIADKLLVDQIEEEMFANDKLRRQAQNNDKENFKYGFDEALLNAFIDRMGDNQQMFEKFMTNSEFKSILHDWLLDKLYNRFNSL